MSALFSFARRQGWIQENPCDRLERITIEHRPPRILTTDECRRLLDVSDPRLRPWIVLGLFAGLRPDEAARLEWGAVRLSSSSLVVDAAASKVRRRRVVSLNPTAVRWLAMDVRSSGRVTPPHSTMRRLRRAAAEAAGIEWSQDVLRHTHASMRIASGDMPETVARDLGNSTGILLRHYRELVEPVEAARFWALCPPGEPVSIAFKLPDAA